jgi:predicted Zn-dependent peptidase
VVAGAVSFDPVMAYAEPLLGPWTNPTPPGAPPAAPPPASARFVLRGQPGREQTRVTVSFPVRVEGARERAVFRVACGLLSPWQSSRLMRVLRHERGDVYFLEGDCRFADGAFEIRVEREFARDGAAASLRVIRDAASALARGDAPVTAGEVDLVRRQVFSRWRTVVDSQEAFVQEIFQEAEEGWAIDGSPPPWIDALRTVTPDEVDAFVRRELSTDRARVDVVGDPGAITPESFAGLGFGPPTRE